MYSWDDPDDRVAIVQMNADLRHAQMDLLSAECATERLRRRFSVADLARHGEKVVLRKTIGSALALSEFYLSLRDQLPDDALPLNEAKVREAVRCVATYLESQREDFFPRGIGLKEAQKVLLQPFFAPALLDRVRTVELHGHRLPPPPFYPEARALGLEHLPELTHMTSCGSGCAKAGTNRGRPQTHSTAGPFISRVSRNDWGQDPTQPQRGGRV